MTDKKDALAIVPRSVQEARDLAATYARSALLPADLKGREADVFVVVMAGLELGMAPMAALRNMHVVKGRPILSADCMVGLVKSSGLCESFACTAESDTSVTYTCKRKGEKAQEYTFTMADAQRAGLNGEGWKKYPRAMLKARAKAALARDVFPDVLAGVYEDGERDEIADRQPAPAENVTVLDAEFTEQEPPEVVALEADILAATSVQRLGELVDRLKALPEGPAKGRLRQAYRDAQSRLVRDYASGLKGGRPAAAETQDSAPAPVGAADEQTALPLDDDR